MNEITPRQLEALEALFEAMVAEDPFDNDAQRLLREVKAARALIEVSA